MTNQISNFADAPPGEIWRPQRCADILLQPAGAETLLYDPRTDDVHALNQTALAIWELCDGGHTTDDMAQTLRLRFNGVDNALLTADVNATLALFAQNRLLVLSPTGQEPQHT